MNPKEIIEKLKLTFNELVNTNQPLAFIKAILMDGTEVEVTEMAVGGIVTIMGVPAPIGEHQLQDGSVIVVGDNGAITEIKAAQIEEVAPVMEDMSAKFSAFESATNEKFSSYEVKFSAYELKFADYENKLNKANQVIEALLNVTATLAETPTGVPDVSIKTNTQFKEEKKVSYDILFS